MFDAPVDAWFVWIGLVVASGAALTVASAMPAAPPPDSGSVANTLDSTSASEHAAVGEHPLPNTESVRIASDTVSLRGPGGTAHASIGYGPLTPAHRDDRLRAVLQGTPPELEFDCTEAFERAVAGARSERPTWHRTERLTVRRITWEGVDAVLVG